MKLKDVINPKNIICDLSAPNRDAAIIGLVGRMCETEILQADCREDAILALLKREATASTGIGNGVGIPHAKVPFVSTFIGALGISERGLDFGAADGEPVHVIFLFFSPDRAQPQDHLKFLAHISRILNNKDFIQVLRQAEDVEKLGELVQNAEQWLFDGREGL